MVTTPGSSSTGTTPPSVQPAEAPRSEYDILAAQAAAKHRRLRVFLVLLGAAAALFVISAKMHWYSVVYTSDSFGGVALANRPQFTLDAGQMAAVARSEPASYTVNPTVDQVLGLPLFAVAAVVGTLIALVGLYFRSTALTLLGAAPLLFAWVKLAQARYWFEAAPGRDGWSIERSAGQHLFWFTLLATAVTIAAGAYQASVAYRADRKARAAGGQQVEDTAFDLFVKVIARGATNTVAAKTADRQPG